MMSTCTKYKCNTITGKYKLIVNKCKHKYLLKDGIDEESMTLDGREFHNEMVLGKKKYRKELEWAKGWT